MCFNGIDLAADPKYTGLATLRQNATSLVLETLTVGATDEHLVHAIRDGDSTGVDVPLGWPQPFVQFIQHQAKQTLNSPADTGPAWRRSLALRTTDIEVHRRTGLTPLSVSANLIAYPAFRWAGIESRLREMGTDVSRDGSGTVAEVYPAAALYCWGLPHTGYKTAKNRAKRAVIIEALSQRFASLDWNGYEALALADDNALDAVIAALVAHQIAHGRCVGPEDRHRQVAAVEGWIWIPKTPES